MMDKKGADCSAPFSNVTLSCLIEMAGGVGEHSVDLARIRREEGARHRTIAIVVAELRQPVLKF